MNNLIKKIIVFILIYAPIHAFSYCHTWSESIGDNNFYYAQKMEVKSKHYYSFSNETDKERDFKVCMYARTEEIGDQTWKEEKCKTIRLKPKESIEKNEIFTWNIKSHDHKVNFLTSTYVENYKADQVKGYEYQILNRCNPGESSKYFHEKTSKFNRWASENIYIFIRLE